MFFAIFIFIVEIIQRHFWIVVAISQIPQLRSYYLLSDYLNSEMILVQNWTEVKDIATS